MSTTENDFLYNTVLQSRQYCGRNSKIAELEKLVMEGKKIVVYAPRRYGKTSLCQNIIKERFVKNTKSPLPIYCDFMDVNSLEDINDRLGDAIALSFNHFFPVKSTLKSLFSLIKNASFSINSNALTGEMDVQFVPGSSDKLKLEKNLSLLLTLSKKYNLLLIFDEFQDLYYVNTALAKMRSQLQQLQKTPIIMLWSKKKLLSEIFAHNNSPFFNFATEYTLPPVDIADWVPYFNKRFKSVNLTIDKETLKELSLLCCHVPNSICEIGAALKVRLKNKAITVADVLETILEIVNQRQQSYRFQLSPLSSNEKKFLRIMSEKAFVSSFLNKDFIASLRLSASGTKKIGERLLKIGMIDEEEGLGLRISNPLLRYFLMTRH